MRAIVVSAVVIALLASSATASIAADPARVGTIAFEARGGLYLIDANGGDHRKIPGTLPRDGDPSWSPDGSQIAFDRGGEDRDVYVMNADGTALRRLTFAPGDDGWPRWAPYGGALTFESDRDGEAAAYVIDLARGQARRVARGGGYPEWRADGRIAFANEDGDLESVLPYGARRRVEARASPETGFWAVRASADGQRIVFTDDSLSPPHRLYTARGDGSGVRLVLRGTLEVFNPAWSPDGGWITMSLERPDDAIDVYVVRTDGSGLTRLSKGALRGTACCSDWTALPTSVP
jgi:Tol biopolymer transport system component